MTEAETAAKGQRAALCNEFIGPMLFEIKDGYISRLYEIASTELSPKVRTEKITALSIAIKIVDQLENGLNAAIEAGTLAERSMVKAGEIERMGREQRRIFDLVPLR